MKEDSNNPKITIFDTTMRDGELMPGFEMNLQQKIDLALLLEEMGVDVIEVGYPSNFAKDFEEISTISQRVQNSIVYGLAGSKADEILKVAQAIKDANKGRIHVYSLVNLKERSRSQETQIELIENSLKLAKKHCEDIEWSAFDAPRSDFDFVCRAIEKAIVSGATTISIPDSFGTLIPEEFTNFILAIANRVPNIDRATISVHCHNDLGLAVENSLAALKVGARQIECSINGVGARKGNADLAEIVRKISFNKDYKTNLKIALLDKASELIKIIRNR